MNGVGTGCLPKHTTELSDGHVISNLVKRLWGRYVHSAQRASAPPPRLLLVVLLSAQILFLAVVRLGPASPLWSSSTPDGTPSSSSVTVPRGHVPALDSMDQENEASPHTDSKKLQSLPASSSSLSLSASSSSLPLSYAANDDDRDLKDSPSNDVLNVSEDRHVHKPSFKGENQVASPSKKRRKAKKRKKNKRKIATAASNDEVPVGGDVKVTGDQSQGGSDNEPPSDDQKVGDDFRDGKVKESPSSSQSSDDLLPSVSDDLLAEPIKTEVKDREDMATVRGEPTGEGQDAAPAIATSTDVSKREEALVAERGWEAAPVESEAHHEQPVAEEGKQREAEAQSTSMATEFSLAEVSDARSEELMTKEVKESPSSSQSPDDLLPSVSDDLLGEPIKTEVKDREDMVTVQGEGQYAAPAMATPTDVSKREEALALVAKSGWEAAPVEPAAHNEQPVAEEGKQRKAEAQSTSMSAKEREVSLAEVSDARSEELLTKEVKESSFSSQSSDDVLPSVSDDLLAEPIKMEVKDREDMATVQGEPTGEGQDAAPATATPTQQSRREEVLVAESGWEAAPAEPEAHNEQPVAEEWKQNEAEAQSTSMATEEREFSLAEVSDARSEGLLRKEDEGAPSQEIAGVNTIVSENEVKHQALVKKEEPLIKQNLEEESGSSECKYGYIYVYDLPTIFNRDIVENCSALNPWVDVCRTLLNGGLGDSLAEVSPLNQTGSWFVSDQFTAEVVFHNRLLQHACLTDKPEVASGFYVPYYAGLDVGRYLWREHPAERRDRVSNQLLQWLGDQEAWKRSGGWDHFLMIGRITWDFRRSRDEDWGSGFFHHPLTQNMTRLLIERNPWDNKEMAVPYPTNFHPQSDADLREWQNYIRSSSRSKLFSFAGARRSSFPNDFRGILLDQCQQAQSCGTLDCSNHECDNNQKTLELFMDSAFCLQPRGDSFTRRSTFDCMLAGAIPVFFWHRSAYMQYKWHLPDDAGSYSVFISRDDVRNGTKVEDVLSALSLEMVQAMREAVIRLVPRIVYATSGFSLKEERDAFDVAIEGVMRRFKELGFSTQK